MNRFNNKMRYILPTLVSLLFIQCAFGQDPLIRHYATRDGLPSSTIYPMIQDKDGFIWFGTNVGVTRFDGKNFKNFTLADGLSDNYILKVKQDSKGRIWFMGFNGTVSYWLNGKIYNARSDHLLKGITSANSFINLFEDNEKRLWFVSLIEYVILDKNGIKRIDTIGLSQGIIFNDKSGPTLISPNLHAQYTSGKLHFLKLTNSLQYGGGYWNCNNGEILFMSNAGLIKQNDTFQKLLIPFSGEFIKDLRYGSLSLSKDSLLWIASHGKGLFRYDLKNLKAKPRVYLKGKVLTGVLEDREGNLWLSTIDEGLFMIPVFGKDLTVINKEKGLENNHCYAINKLNSGKLIVGLGNGKLHLISDTQTSSIIIPKYDNFGQKVNRIKISNEDVWIATEGGLIHQNFKKGCNHFVHKIEINKQVIGGITNIKDITLSHDKLFFIGLNRIIEYPLKCPGSSFLIKLNHTNAYKRTYSIYFDHSGTLWYGDVNGLQSKNGQQVIDHSKEDVHLHNRINCIAETEDSTLVLATHGYGVLFYKKGRIINRATTAEGLCDDICRKVFIDKNIIYISTPSGVAVLHYLNNKVYQIRNLNIENFLPSNDVNDVYADGHHISVATMEGVVVIPTRVLQKNNHWIPSLYLTDVLVNDSNISLAKKIDLSYDENSLKIKFIGMYFQFPNAVNYRYRLKNDQNWQTTTSNLLEFSFLPAGNYSFQLQARVGEGNWSPVKRFDFTINPPFWETWWFIVILTLLFLMMVIAAALYRISYIERINRIKLNAINAELQALRSQMNPHFVFNSLNSIQDFVLKNQKKEASIYLSDFAQLMRLTLENARRDQLPLSEEIVFLTKYVEMEQLRLSHSFQFKVEVDETINPNECDFPSMLLQPFIENAIHHGLQGKPDGLLLLSFIKHDHDLQCIIEDNGMGRDMVNRNKNSVHRSAAMDIITSRIDKYNSEGRYKIRMTIEDLKDPEGLASGTKIELNFSGYFPKIAMW